MSEGPWWASSPIVVMPLAAFALGLAVVPFAIASTDHAAQFYGAFIAALVAAGAVIGTTTLSAQLARQQRRDERHTEMLAEALELYAWMGNLASEFNYVAIVLERWLESSPPPEITAANVRSNLSPDVRIRLRNRLIIASRLPNPFGHHLVDTLHRADSMLDTICYVPMLVDTTVFPPAELQVRQRLATHFSRTIRWHKARLAEFLVSQGTIAALGDEDRNALQAGLTAFQA